MQTMYFNPIARSVVLTFLSLLIAMPLLAHGRSERCSAPWPFVQPVFESSIRYGDPLRKADPFITVRIGGRPASMLLDTGSNRHVVWDARLLPVVAEIPAQRESLSAIASSAPAKRLTLDVEDEGGHNVAQDFYAIDETPLMAEGFSGIVSPQYLANDKVAVLNFKDDCFFISDRFEPTGDGRFRITDGTSLLNVHRVMAIAVAFKGARIPVVVDSGAYATTLLTSLIQDAEPGALRRKTVDLLGQPIEGEAHMRRVDLTIHGERIVRHPVAPQAQAHDAGIASLGAIGMDVLRNRIVFHDNERNRFAMIEPLDALRQTDAAQTP